MKKITLLNSILIAIISIFFQINSNAQTLVNREWVTTGGNPNEHFEYISGAGANGFIYIVGSTYRSNQQDNFFIAKIVDDGTIYWIKEFNSLTDYRDFGIDIVAKDTLIYVTGMSWDSISGTSKIVTLRLDDNNGNIVWSQSWGSRYNVPVKITADNNGNVYVGGTAETSASEFAMVVLKYSPSGSLDWASTYDSIGVIDGAVALVLDSPQNNLTITGYSGNGFNNWDFTTVQMDVSTGNIKNTTITQNGNGGFNKPVGISGNGTTTYIGGTVTHPTTGKKRMKIIGYDYQWQEVNLSYYGDSLTETEAVDMHNDFTGANVLLATHTRTDGHKEIIVTRYALTDGSLLWDRTLSAPSGEDAEANSFTIAGDANNIYLTGSIKSSSGRHRMLTAAYDLDGNLMWMKEFNRTATSDDRGKTVDADVDGNPVTTGVSTDNDTTTYVSVKYGQKVITNIIIYDTLGKPNYINNQILVRFKPSQLNLSFIDNKEIMYTTLDEIIADSIITEISSKCNFDLHGATVSKIVENMTSADQFSIARNGDTIPLPKFWASLLLTISPTSRSTVDISKGLDSCQPYIFYASPNHVGTFDCSSNPNDPQFLSQLALSSSNNGVNWCPDWNNTAFSQGSSNIKIGVYDTGINADHEDLQFNGQRKILGGKDYTVSTVPNILSTPNSDASGHGTAVMGIIGAQTDNGKGLVGVVGGNGGSGGCSLYCNKIGNSSPTVTTATIYNALISDASSTGLGFHIINHSYHFGSGDVFLHAGFRFAAQNGVVDVCASGSNGAVATNAKNYPSAYRTQWILKVGANDATGDWASFSDFGPTVDIIAPGTPDLYKLLSNTSNTGYTTTIGGSPAKGNSFSAAYASGAAGLILSHVNGNGPSILAPEDVEFVLKANATQVNVSYDDIHVGNGRLDIGNSLNHIVFPRYKIRHFSATGGVVVDATGVIRNQTMHFLNDYEINNPNISSNIIKFGKYFVDVWPVEATLNYTIPSNEHLISAWPLATQSDFWEKRYFHSFTSDELDPDPAPSLTNYNSSQARMTGFVYHIIADNAGNPMDIWLPFDSSKISSGRMVMSVYTIDSTISGIENEEIQNKLAARVYPSPTSNSLNVDYLLNQTSSVEILITDINGKVVLENIQGTKAIGQHSATFNVSNLAIGMYMITIRTKDQSFRTKFIKD